MKKILQFLFLSLLLALQLPSSFGQAPTPANTGTEKLAKQAPANPNPVQVAPAPASVEADAPEQASPLPANAATNTTTDSIGTVKEIDGQQFILVATEIDATTGQVIAIWKEYKENQGDIWGFIIRLFANGTLVVIFTQLIKTSKLVKDFIGSIERPQRLAFFISGALTAGWIGISTGFKDFTVVELAMKWLITFGTVIGLWELPFVRNLFKKKTAAAPPAATTA